MQLAKVMLYVALFNLAFLFGELALNVLGVVAVAFE